MLAFTAGPAPTIDIRKRAANQVLNVNGIFNTGNKVFNDNIKAIGINMTAAITNTIAKAIRNSFIYLIFYITIPKDQAITIKKQ